MSSFGLVPLERRAWAVSGRSEWTTCHPVKHYLLTSFCINNGSRSGTLADMTLREFEQASIKNDCFIVRVKDHKTFTKHGPVNVVFNASHCKI